MTVTIKQKLALKEIAENHRSVSGAMLAVGYSPNTASKPKNLTESKGWKELMDQYLPDNKLLKKHEETLEATKWNDFTGEREPDHTTRLKGVELGYKIKRKVGDTNVNINETKILVMPSVLIDKYGISSDTDDSSK